MPSQFERLRIPNQGVGRVSFPLGMARKKLFQAFLLLLVASVVLCLVYDILPVFMLSSHHTYLSLIRISLFIRTLVLWAMAHPTDLILITCKDAVSTYIGLHS